MTEKNPLLLNILSADNRSQDTNASDSPQPRSVVNDADRDSAFEAVLQSLDVSSVFDIVRTPKASFCEQLTTACQDDPLLHTVNAELTYDHALCYATQIGRLYREQRVHAGGSDRSLGDHPDSPSYKNLFDENWGEFCKVGAIAAVDSPVAYLSSLHRLITSVVEPGGEGTRAKVKLQDRRPDLQDLLIDQQSTFTPLPVLTIANEVLAKSIESHLGHNPAKLAELMTSKRHPFGFPYDFTHQQCQLGLSESDAPLGDISYRTSLQLPIHRDGANDYGQHQHPSSMAQALRSGLSPEQQSLLTQPTLFSDFYLSRSQLEAGRWVSPGANTFSPWQNHGLGYLLLDQPSIKSCTPSAAQLTHIVSHTQNTVEINFTHPKLPTRSVAFLTNSQMGVTICLTNFGKAEYHNSRALAIELASDATLPTELGYQATFDVMIVADEGLELPAPSVQTLFKRRITINLDTLDGDTYWLPEPERLFFKEHYGVVVSSSQLNPLTALNTFMAQTGLAAASVEALLAVRQYAPCVSPNCHSLNPMRNGINGELTFPHSTHYGACYVNGAGALDANSKEQDHFDNSLRLEELTTENGSVWRMANTSLHRFDRLQRMIRLQQWTGVPFAQLDTLVVAAMRAEGEANVQMALNENTLRTLGVWRHLNERYGIEAEEFAAFMHYLSPYADTDRTPLFDEVFNSPVLFDTPLILDQTPFDPANESPADQQTVHQLCAGLGAKPTPESFDLLASNTRTHVGPLKRSLAIVSSLYRQARIARMFGLSIEDSWWLAELLGGAAYQQAIASGKLRTQGTQPDILDIIMQMDWAVTWIKQSRQTVTAVRAHLGFEPSPLLATQPLVDRLERLYQDLEQSVATTSHIIALNLPNSPTRSINWRTELERTLLTRFGLVNGLPLEPTNDTKAQLNVEVQTLLEPLDINATQKTAAQTALVDYLLNLHEQQLRLLEGLMQELANLPLNCTAAVAHWSGHSAESVFTLLVIAVQNRRLAADNFDPALLNALQQLVRRAQTANTFNLSEPALRMFLVSPESLGAALIDETQALAPLYLLSRFSHLVHEAEVADAELLNYLLRANSADTSQTYAESIAGELAQLLDWSKSELWTLVSTLPDKKASSLAHIDWLYRCKQTSHNSGLTAASLLLAVSLSPESDLSRWRTMGNAAIAATR